MGSQPHPQPVWKVTKAGTISLLVIFFCSRTVGVHISSRGPEPVPWGIIGRWPRGSGGPGGRPALLQMWTWPPGGMQRGPAECERLWSTSVLEVIWDVTTFSLSPRDGVHRTSVKEAIGHGALGIVKIPLILGCTGLVQGSPPSILTLVPQVLMLLSAGFCLLALLVLFCSVNYWLNSVFLISEIPGRYAWLGQCLHPHHQRHHNQPGPAVDGAAHSDHLHVQPVPSLTPLQPPAWPGLCPWAHGPPKTWSDQDHWHHRGSQEER